MSQSTLEPAAARFPSDERQARGLLMRLESCARRVVQRRRRIVLQWVLAALVSLLAVAALIDYLWPLSSTVRAAWLVLMSVSTVAGVTLAFRRWANRFAAEDAAAAIEARWPAYGQRLRTALDYENPQSQVSPASPQLVAALRQEMQQGVRDEHLAAPAAQQRTTWSLAACGALLLLCLILLAANYELRIAAGRTLLLPWEYTTVTFDPQQMVLKEGERATINVHISGRPVVEASLRYRTTSGGAAGTWHTMPLTDGKTPEAITEDTANDTADDDREALRSLHGDLTASIADCREDLEFQVVAGPRALPLGSIRVLRPLILESFSAHITPPSYTRHEEEETDQLEMKVLEGSDVALRLQYSRAAEQVQLVSLEQPSATSAAADSPLKTLELALAESVATLTLHDLRRDQTFEIQARTADGVDADAQRLVIRVQLDNKPRIRIVKPSEQIEVTATTEVPVAVEALDDLALMQVGVLYQVGDGPLQTLWQKEFPEATREAVRHAPQLMLEEQQLTFKDSVTYYAFADDDYFGETRRTVTPLQFIDIRPYKRAYQMLDNGGT